MKACDLPGLATIDWLGPLEQELRSIDQPHCATLVLAVIRGRLIDLDATDDRARVDRAFADFLGMLAGRDTDRPPGYRRRAAST
jgi:hypothetical protein